MGFGRRQRMREVPATGAPDRSAGPLVSVVVPVYNVREYVAEAITSVLASDHRQLQVVVVDDGSTDGSGDIVDRLAAADPRVEALHTGNQGLGAARNAGLRRVSGDYVTFADSDDIVPATAYADLVASLERTGSDFAVGSVQLWRGDDLREPPWLRRLHRPPLEGARATDRPRLLGDVFAWNKLFRRSWWDERGLSWPEGVRYEDQPTATRAYLDGVFDVLEQVVYHWRIRDDGSSITQQRGTVADLRDRWLTKQQSLASVRASADADALLPAFVDAVLPGDLWRYFLAIPGAGDEWWDLLVAGVREIWGEHRSLTASTLPPVHRLTGWLVEQDRRADAAAVAAWAAARDRRPDRLPTPDGGWRLDVPVLDVTTVAPEALTVRDHEV